MVLCAVSIGHAVKIEYTFDTDAEGFTNVTWEDTNPAAWADIPSIQVNPAGGGWQNTQIKDFVWGAAYGGSANEQEDMQTLANNPYAKISFDVMVDGTSFNAGEAGWYAMRVIGNSDGSAGWTEKEIISSWHNADDSALFTWHFDMVFADLGWEPGDSWFQFSVGSNSDGTFPIRYFIDNMVLTAAEPTPWVRMECEDAILNAEAYIQEDGDCSGGQYVHVTSDQIEGSILFNVNVRDAGTYNMRYGQNSFDAERYESIFVNDAEQVAQQFAGLISWGAAAAIEGNNNWSEEAIIQDLFDSVELYGSEDGDWQIWSRFAEAWNTDRLNTQLTLDLEAGLNTVEIRTVWGWDDWDYIELELGIMPKNPNPADGSIAVIADATTLSWDNAMPNLDSIEVWFGVSPTVDPNDPNTILSGSTYKDLLTLIHTETTPGETTSIAMPTLTNGVNYTWVVDGLIEGDVDPNDQLFGGPFWSFYATDNAPPVADAGEDQYKWLIPPDPNVVITLDGTGSTDDGKDAPLTYNWTQTAGPAATIITPNADTTQVTLTGGLGNNTEAGTPAPYEFQLEIYDGLWTETAAVTIHVNSNSCTASIEAGSYYYNADIASAAGAGIPDCKVDLLDFAEMAINWLGCTNIFETCD